MPCGEFKKSFEHFNREKVKKNMRILCILSIAAMLFGCCCDVSNNAATTPFNKASLEETAWTPTYLINREGAQMPDAKRDGQVVFIDFHKDGNFNGMSGDNLFGGKAEVSENGDFKAQNVYSTRRMGPYSEYEMKFLDALNKANKIELKSDNLKLMLDNRVLLEFKRMPKPVRN